MKLWKFSEIMDLLRGGKAEIGEDDLILTGSPPDPARPPAFSEADLEKARKEAADEARKKVEAEFAERARKADAERARAARGASAAAFCEAGVKAGKLLPAWVKGGLAEFLEGLDDAEPVEFGEEKKSLTPHAWMIGFLETLPAVVNFSEIAGREKAVGDLTYAQALEAKIKGGLAKTRAEAVKLVAAEFSGSHEEYQAYVAGK